MNAQQRLEMIEAYLRAHALATSPDATEPVRAAAANCRDEIAAELASYGVHVAEPEPVP